MEKEDANQLNNKQKKKIHIYIEEILRVGNSLLDKKKITHEPLGQKVY